MRFLGRGGTAGIALAPELELPKRVKCFAKLGMSYFLPMILDIGSRFRLPYSGTLANISWRYHQGSILSDDHRLWIAPHVPVELSSEDYFANRDPALEAVLEVIRRHPSSGRGHR